MKNMQVVTLGNILQRGMISNHYTETTESLNAYLCQVCPTRKMSQVLPLHTTLGHTQVCTLQRPSTNSGCTVQLYQLYSPNLAPSDYHLFGPWKKACEDNITLIVRHCRMHVPVTANKRELTSARREYCCSLTGQNGCQKRWVHC